MNVKEYNRAAWDREVERGNQWSQPVSTEVVSEARMGRWNVLLTETKFVPREWFPEMKNLDVLCLASGGGQQAPTFAAAGANVTVLDNSPKQLEQDRFVAERENLEIKTVLGLMDDLSAFSDESFDLIFHPVANCFAPEVRPVWQEAFRVLRRGGVLLAGFNKPVLYIFNQQAADNGLLEIKYTLPYSDLHSLTDEERRLYTDNGEPLEFSHTLTDQIGGQLDAGFLIAGLYEDFHLRHPLSRFMPTYIATRAIKP